MHRALFLTLVVTTIGCNGHTARTSPSQKLIIALGNARAACQGVQEIVLGSRVSRISRQLVLKNGACRTQIDWQGELLTARQLRAAVSGKKRYLQRARLHIAPLTLTDEVGTPLGDVALPDVTFEVSLQKKRLLRVAGKATAGRLGEARWIELPAELLSLLQKHVDQQRAVLVDAKLVMILAEDGARALAKRSAAPHIELAVKAELSFSEKPRSAIKQTIKQPASGAAKNPSKIPAAKKTAPATQPKTQPSTP